MTAPIKLAIVGLGKIAHDQHLPSIAASSDYELVATVVRHGTGIADVPYFRTVEELAKSGTRVDALSICTPPQVRHDIAQFAIDQGWHTMLEKPPGATLAEVTSLRDSAAERQCALFTTWHSQCAPGVDAARAWLAHRTITSAKVVWREDVRVWHPGQSWIWQPGGFGVFDPGINALSILTRIMPSPLFVTQSRLEIPANLFAPIAAQLTLRDRNKVPVEIDFDFRQEGPQHWDIVVETDGGTLHLANGGAILSINGVVMQAEDGDLAGEYPKLYHLFADSVRTNTSHVDIAPLRLVADAFLCGKITMVAEFHE